MTTIQAMMVQLVLVATNHRRSNRTKKKRKVSLSFPSNSLNKSVPRRNDSSWRRGLGCSPSSSGLVLVLAGIEIIFWDTPDHIAPYSAYKAGEEGVGNVYSDGVCLPKSWLGIREPF